MQISDENSSLARRDEICVEYKKVGLKAHCGCFCWPVWQLVVASACVCSQVTTLASCVRDQERRQKTTPVQISWQKKITNETVRRRQKCERPVVNIITSTMLQRSTDVSPTNLLRMPVATFTHQQCLLVNNYVNCMSPNFCRLPTVFNH